MFIDSETKREVNIHYAYKGFSRLDTPEIRARAGVVEIPDPVPSEDIREDVQAHPDHYIVSPTGDGSPPYKVWVRKSPEQIEDIEREKVNSAALQYLKETDWYAIRAAETGEPIPVEVLGKRQAARDSIVVKEK